VDAELLLAELLDVLSHFMMQALLFKDFLSLGFFPKVNFEPDG